MQTITVERVIAAPPAAVFDWLANAQNYPRSRVVLRNRLARKGTDAPYGRDAVRVLTWVIGWFRERITSYNPPHDFGYLVERSFPPSRHEGGALTFTEVDGGTRVTWTTTGQIAAPFAADTLTRLLMKPVVTFAFGGVLAAADRELSNR
ncbi:SRPBCC family protein [Nocardia sp. 2]|uniref:SRPBCC family protein n=1 Tax=Nocardia acididurans TaxID=2802282 RepID=A0ABS1MBN0_9NOCA|nr:SRPBCC family protein [Nocardia acididurans]MBL1077169.1 SRPBCC family protein [Nocardia acididurans]